MGISEEEVLRRSLTEYLVQMKATPAFEPIGFGMWAGRPEMQDATEWGQELRRREWER